MRRLRTEPGFTLIEMVFALAIIAVLAAIIVPIAAQKIAESEIVKAQSDEDGIATAITAFRTDLGIWPASDGSAPKNQSLLVLCVGDGVPALTSPNPTDGTASWTLCTTNSHNAFNHLGVNDPDGDGTPGEPTEYLTTGKKIWKGPYLARFGSDPWGNNYVINMGAITGTGTDNGWIISAGPDGTLQTADSASVVSGDDIGFVFCTSCG